MTVRLGMWALFVAGCNVVTGADGLRTREDGESDDASDGSGASGAGSGSGSPSSGSGADMGGSTAMGGSTGAGGDPTTSASGTGGGATSSAAATSSSSGGGGGPMCGGAGPATTPLDAEESAFLTIINDYRAQNGLGALTHCISLDRAAQGHSEDMRDQDYFDHIGLDSSTPWSRSCDACFDQGCGPTTAMAENIAAGNSGAQATFTQWQNSPGHNANMLNGTYTMIGIGRATGGGMYGVYWTNVFAATDEPSCY